MIYHCRVFDAEGFEHVTSYRHTEVQEHLPAPGKHVGFLELPTGEHCFTWVSIDDADPDQIPRIVSHPRTWFRFKPRDIDPNRQPPCFLAPDGKIYRSSDYQEVF